MTAWIYRTDPGLPAEPSGLALEPGMQRPLGEGGLAAGRRSTSRYGIPRPSNARDGSISLHCVSGAVQFAVTP